MFNEKWFAKHQKLLLWIVNTKLGRRFFCIDGNRSSVGSNRILKIEPSAIFWKGKKKRQIVAEFRSNNKFARRIYFGLRPLWHLIHFWDMNFANRINYSLNLGFDTLTQYPDATHVDGRTARSATNETFANIIAGAGTHTTGAQPDSVTAVGLTASGTTDQYNDLFRYITMFDTSSIGSNTTITAVTLSMWGNGAAVQGIGNNQMDVCSANPNSETDIVAGDFTTLGSTTFGNVTTGAWSNGSYNDISLNASGIANVSKTATSKFGLRMGWDIAGSFDGTWASGQSTNLPSYGSGHTGTTNDPKLVVTYTILGGTFDLISRYW